MGTAVLTTVGAGGVLVGLFGYLFKELRLRDAAAVAPRRAAPAPAADRYQKRVRREFIRLYGRRNWDLLQAPPEPLAKGLVVGCGQAPKNPPPAAARPPCRHHAWAQVDEFGKAAVYSFCIRCGTTELDESIESLRRLEDGLPERNESR